MFRIAFLPEVTFCDLDDRDGTIAFQMRTAKLSWNVARCDARGLIAVGINPDKKARLLTAKVAMFVAALSASGGSQRHSDAVTAMVQHARHMRKKPPLLAVPVGFPRPRDDGPSEEGSLLRPPGMPPMMPLSAASGINRPRGTAGASLGVD